MREIKFRGKCIDMSNDMYGKWIFGHLVVRPIHDNSGDRYFICEAGHKFIKCIGKMTSTYEVDPETVGQYTGLTDKNGKKIFEDDIIKTHYANAPKADFIEQVVFHNGRFCAMFEHNKMGMLSSLVDGIKHIPQDESVYMEFCEVIGNIHDNPELIAVQEGER